MHATWPAAYNLHSTRREGERGQPGLVTRRGNRGPPRGAGPRHARRAADPVQRITRTRCTRHVHERRRPAGCGLLRSSGALPTLILNLVAPSTVRVRAHESAHSTEHTSGRWSWHGRWLARHNRWHLTLENHDHGARGVLNNRHHLRLGEANDGLTAYLDHAAVHLHAKLVRL